MRFGSQEHYDQVCRNIAYLPLEHQHRILKAHAKAVARHFGLDNKYDGQGRKRELPY